jgi:hypothetical protein
LGEGDFPIDVDVLQDAGVPSRKCQTWLDLAYTWQQRGGGRGSEARVAVETATTATTAMVTVAPAAVTATPVHPSRDLRQQWHIS